MEERIVTLDFVSIENKIFNSLFINLLPTNNFKTFYKLLNYYG